MNDMQLAMVKSGIVSSKDIRRAEAEEEERLAKQEEIRRRNIEISRQLKTQAEQLESRDDAERKRDAHRRYMESAPRRKHVVN